MGSRKFRPEAEIFVIFSIEVAPYLSAILATLEYVVQKLRFFKTLNFQLYTGSQNCLLSLSLCPPFRDFYQLLPEEKAKVFLMFQSYIQERTSLHDSRIIKEELILNND